MLYIIFTLIMFIGFLSCTIPMGTSSPGEEKASKIARVRTERRKRAVKVVSQDKSVENPLSSVESPSTSNTNEVSQDINQAVSSDGSQNAQSSTNEKAIDKENDDNKGDDVVTGNPEEQKTSEEVPVSNSDVATGVSDEGDSDKADESLSTSESGNQNSVDSNKVPGSNDGVDVPAIQSTNPEVPNLVPVPKQVKNSNPSEDLSSERSESVPDSSDSVPVNEPISPPAQESLPVVESPPTQEDTSSAGSPSSEESSNNPLKYPSVKDSDENRSDEGEKNRPDNLKVEQERREKEEEQIRVAQEAADADRLPLVDSKAIRSASEVSYSIDAKTGLRITEIPEHIINRRGKLWDTENAFAADITSLQSHKALGRVFEDQPFKSFYNPRKVMTSKCKVYEYPGRRSNNVPQNILTKADGKNIYIIDYDGYKKQTGDRNDDIPLFVTGTLYAIQDDTDKTAEVYGTLRILVRRRGTGESIDVILKMGHATKDKAGTVVVQHGVVVDSSNKATKGSLYIATHILSPSGELLPEGRNAGAASYLIQNLKSDWDKKQKVSELNLFNLD